MVPLGWVRFEFIPATDDGYFMVTTELPPGSSLAATEEALRAVDAKLGAIPEIEYYLTQSGVGGYVGGGGNSMGVEARNARFGRTVVVMHDRHERHRTTQEVVEQVSAETADIPGATVRATVQGGAGSAAPVQVRVEGEDPEVLKALAARVEEIVRNTPGARDVANSSQEGNPEVRLVPDRRRMADLGITAQQTAQALRVAVEGSVATKLRPAGRDEIDVRLIADPATRDDFRDLSTLPLTGLVGGQPTSVYLNQVTYPEFVAGPTSIDRRNRQRVVTVSAGLAGTTPLNDVTQPVERAIRELRAQGVIPSGYNVVLGGQAEDQAEAFSSLFLALGLSLLLEYMLMSALYESMMMPFARMFALPVAIVGAFLALAISGNTLNLLSMIGMIVLMGLVGKNGVLIIDYTNTLRHRGMSRHDALMESCPARLRPILMTTAALVFGMLPLALKIEAGSDIYGGMATVIIGGMLSSTVLSLFLVPCMYTYFDDLELLIRRLWRWRPFRGPRGSNQPPAVEPIPVAEAPPPRELEKVGSPT
jgi:hydrophobic/amphiphilic exporter-1 (mainly G- bacteria), HAE1 family